MSGRDRFPWIAGAVVAVATAVLLSRTPQIIGGDGFAVYLPVVWGLEDGLGLQAFEALQFGVMRLPGYPVLVYLTRLVTGDAIIAVTVLQVIAAAAFAVAFTFAFAPLLGRAACALALVLFFFSNTFAEGLFTSTPDVACLAATTAAIALIVRAPDRRRWFFAGVLAGAAMLLRFNAIHLPLFLLVTALGWHPERRGDPRDAVPFALGVLLPAGTWSAISFALRGNLFWIAEGPVPLPFSTYHPELVAPGETLLGLLTASPGELVLRALHRGLLAGPVEVATRAFWTVPACIALTAPAWLRREHLRRAIWFGALVLASWLLIAPAHFEARYYPVQVLALAIGAAWAPLRLLRALMTSSVAAPALAAVLALIIGVDRRHAYAQRIDACNHAYGMIRWSRTITTTALALDPGTIGISTIAHRLSPIQQTLREHNAGAKLACCDTAAGHATYVHLAGYGSPPEGTTRVELPEPTGPLELYRVTR